MSRVTKGRVIASVAILAWAAALQLHMNFLQSTEEFKQWFPDLASSESQDRNELYVNVRRGERDA